jgi:hypothetical protein
VGTGIAALVARLRELKDQGWDFDAAWKRALEDCQIDVRRGVCRDAWMDAPSVLGGPSRMRLLTDPSVLAPALAGSPARRAAA